MSIALVCSAVLAAALIVMLSPLIPLWAIVTGLILVRALGDWGIADGRTPLPPGLIGSVVSLAFIICLILPWYRPLPARSLPVVIAAALWCAFFAVIGLLGTVYGTAALGEGVRLFSVVAAGVVAARIPAADYGRLRTGLLLVVLVPALYMILAAALQFPGTVQPDSGRVIGSFSHPNSGGAFFAIGVVVAVSALIRRPSVLALLAAAASTVAALLSQNLGGIAAMFAALLVLRATSIGVSVARRAAELLALAMVGAGVVLFVPQVNGRLEEFRNLDFSAAGISDDSGNSLEWRFINWRRLLESWQEAPWLGHGLSSTDTTIQPLGTTPHSAPLQLMVETGLLGWLTLTLGLLLVLVVAWMRRTPDRPGLSTVISIVTAVLVVGAMDNMLNHAAALYLGATALALGFLSDSRDPDRGEEPAAAVGRRAAPWAEQKAGHSSGSGPRHRAESPQDQAV